MFSFIKNHLQKLYHTVTNALAPLFGATQISTHDLHTLETILLQADVGFKTTTFLLEQIKKEYSAGAIQDGNQLKAVCTTLLARLLTMPPVPPITNIILLVGVNGTGKTTTAAKFAHARVQEGKKTLLVAADTFRAAAPEQLASWANIAGVDIHIGMAHQDPAAVVFSGCERFVKEQYQVLIVDTAGRLHNKVNLMHELAKIKRVMAKVLAHDSVTTLLVIDGMLGQSSFEQARIFKEATQVDGVILTKMDGTAKGGVVFALAHELALPVYALAFGEQMDAFKPFEPRQFVDELLTL